MSRRPTAPADTPTIEVRTPVKAPDLTINKIIAGAGAAATAAVLGSYLGAAGTVAGAALGSVASTVATTLYQRSLDRTRHAVVTRIRPGTIPEQRRRSGADADTVVFEPVPPPRRPWRRALVAAVVVFVLGLAAVTGLEWVKGSTLTTNETGTSVGRVVAPPTNTGAPTDTGTPTDGSTGDGSAATVPGGPASGSKTPTPTPTPPPPTPTPTPPMVPGPIGPTSPPTTDPTATPVPTTLPPSPP